MNTYPKTIPGPFTIGPFGNQTDDSTPIPQHKYVGKRARQIVSQKAASAHPICFTIWIFGAKCFPFIKLNIWVKYFKYFPKVFAS